MHKIKLEKQIPLKLDGISTSELAYFEIGIRRTYCLIPVLINKEISKALLELPYSYYDYSNESINRPEYMDINTFEFRLTERLMFEALYKYLGDSPDTDKFYTGIFHKEETK